MPDVSASDITYVALGLTVVILFSIGVPQTIAARILPGIRAALSVDYYHNMSSVGAGDLSAESSQNTENQQATTTLQTDNNVIAITQNERNDLLLLGRAQALATMVAAKKVTETDGILIVFGVKPSSTSKKYQDARTALRDELAKLQGGPQYRQLDEKKQPVLS